MTIYYVPSRLKSVEVFRGSELAALRLGAERHPLSSLLSNPRWKEESAINFAYTSAQIEGNTYTRDETITLLKMGRTARGKSFIETQMIMNLRDAYVLVLDRPHELVNDGLLGLRQLHQVLMRDILPDSELGATRKTKGARIGGTEYSPPDGEGYVEKQAGILFSRLRHAANAFDASLYAACNLSYLQIFEDGNKRTSRAFQNALLLAASLPPVQFPISMIEAYIEAQLVYYESGDYLMHRGFMLEAYRNSYS